MNKMDYSETFDQNQGEHILLIELKVSSDRGETWERRKVNMVDGLDESGLIPGEMFIWQDEKYEVLTGEDGLRFEPIKKNKKSSGRRR